MSIPLIYREDVVETFTVKRTGRIHISYNESISYNCHLSKNLWNQAHHLVYPEYKEFGYVQSYEDIDATLNKKSYYKKDGKTYPEFDNYHKLGGVIAQQILKVYHKSWISYLKGIKGYWESKKSGEEKDYTGMPREPGYKTKDGEFILIFTNQQCKFRESKDGSVWMYFPNNKGKVLKDKNGKPLKIKLGNINDIDSYLLERLMWSKFDQVRIIPQGVGYIIEIVYDKEVIKDNSKYQLDKDIIMSIDLGVENIGTVTDNIGNRPIIIKSPEIKCANQWYNKKKAELQAIYDRNMIGKACLIKIDKKTKKVSKHFDKYDRIKYLIKKTGHKLDIITDNRNKKVMDELHKFSRGIIRHALYIKAGIIAIGKNPGWKIKVKMGKKNNQSFVNIPFAKLIDLVIYKAEECGITVLSPTENHTSKCSFLDSEEICHHDKYMGTRVKRGMFRSSKGLSIKKGNKTILINEINSDVQGSYNILRNVSPKFTVYSIIEGLAVHGFVPLRLSVSDLLNSTS